VKLSVVTPCFNGRAYLPQTADSVLTQCGNFAAEWLVVDGGSTDGSLDFLRSLHDARLSVISEPDRGQSHAINKGLSRATGDVVAWLNTDDVYTPGALAAVAEAFAQHPQAQWLVGRCEIIDAAGRVVRRPVTRYKDRSLRRYSRRALLRENFISQPAVFWRREFGGRVGPLDESLHWTMDYDLWLRMAAASAPLLPDRVLARFRLHAASKTGRVDRRQFDEQYQVARRHAGPDRLSLWLHRFNVEKIVWAYKLLKALGK
jgi:glycosyltransferase involved in cell wall biosynthesis